jgi:murein DD-endopeptidase MepM/ murein hydrolase activator NlpD
MRSLRTRLLSALLGTAVALGGLTPAATAAASSSVTVSADAAATVTAAPTQLPTPPPALDFTLPVPAKTYNVSSYFGPRCIPVQGGSTYHYGVDLAAKGGTPIYTIAAGVVAATVSGTTSKAGYISVRHSVDGVEYTSIYMHIWSATTRVKVGQIVAAGQRISEVGSSGVSSGNHLHLEVWKATSTGALAQNAAAFLQARGIDLFTSATAVTAKPTPATCTYYTVVGLNLRTLPSTTAPILRVLSRGTAVTHVPGNVSGSFIPVRVGTQSGWVAAAYVSPTKPPPTYATTAALRLRAAPSTSAATILIIPAHASVGVILATSGVWRKVSYAGKTGWVHSAYLVRR